MTAETAAMIMMSGTPDLEELDVTENGVYESVDHDGFSKVTVDVTPDLEDITVTENGEYQSEDHDGFGVVTVDVTPDLEDITITVNGTYRSTQHDGYGTVTVNVPDINSKRWLEYFRQCTTIAEVQVTDYIRAVFKWADGQGSPFDMPEYISDDLEHRPKLLSPVSTGQTKAEPLFTPQPTQSDPWVMNGQVRLNSNNIGSYDANLFYVIYVKATIDETLTDTDILGDRLLIVDEYEQPTVSLKHNTYGDSDTQNNCSLFGCPSSVETLGSPTSLTMTKTIMGSGANSYTHCRIDLRYKVTR